MMLSHRTLGLVYVISALSISSAFAADDTIKNDQRNGAALKSSNSSDSKKIGGTVTQTGAAISNSFSAETSGSSDIRNWQDSLKDTSSKVDVRVGIAKGDLTTSSAGIGNATDAKVNGNTRLESNQKTGKGRFTSGVNLTAAKVGDDVNASSTAIANTLSVETTGTESNSAVTTRANQSFSGSANSNLAGKLGKVNDDVKLESTAVGNASSVNATKGATFDLGNAQTSTGSVSSNTSTQLRKAGGDFKAGATAVGNTFSADIGSTSSGGLANASSNQTSTGPVRTGLKSNLGEVSGKVNLNSTAIGNATDLSVDHGKTFKVTNTQTSSGAITAGSAISLDKSLGSLNSSTTAIGNSLSAESGKGRNNLSLTTRQSNSGDVSATSKISVGSVKGSVTGATAAIGNTATVTNVD